MTTENNAYATGQNTELRPKSYADTLALLGEDIVGIPIPEKTHRAWSTLAAIIRVVDSRIDTISNASTRIKLIQRIEQALTDEHIHFADDRELEQAMIGVRMLGREIPQEREEFFRTLLKLLLDTTESIKNEGDRERSVQLTLLEGQMTAKLFLPFLPDAVRESRHYQRLRRAFIILGRAANSFDTFIDLPLDYAHDQTPLRPTLINRLAFFSAALSEGMEFLSNAKMSRDLLQKLGRAAIDTVQKRRGKREV